MLRFGSRGHKIGLAAVTLLRDKKHMLEKELKYFNKMRDEYLKTYQGQFVVISDQSFLGSYTTEQQAYEAGIQKLGIKTAFLVKQVLPGDKQESIPSYTLGLLRS